MSKKVLPLIKEVQHLLRHYNLNQEDAEEVINAVFDGVVKIVVDEGELKVGRYCKFIVREREERIIKHAQTGEETISPKHKVMGFKPYQIFKDAIR